MKLYSDDKNYKLYCGSMLDMAEVIEPNSIDAIVTDPPYELNFMNCKWDNSGIAFQKETWRKCYDALKSGGHMLVFGGSRTFHRIACAIEDAGFEIRDTIMWLYGSGFPKSMDISKQIDKKAENNDSVIKEKRELGEWLKEKRGNRPQKEISKYFPSKTNNITGCVANWEKGYNLPTWEIWMKLKDILDLDDRYDYLIKDRPSNYIEAEREVIGKKEYTDNKNVMNVSNYNGERVHLDITVPSTDLAKQWDGWGTQLKPSYEPIIVCRKPCEGSIVDNVMKYGVGGINIDECRVPLEENYVYKETNRQDRSGIFDEKNAGTSSFINSENHIASADPNGRFPANTILTYDDSDYNEVCGGFPNTKSSGGSGDSSQGFGGNIYGKYNHDKPISHLGGLGDEGSASRYFYCAKASKRDRNEGLSSNNRNIHPTIKPTSLMQYLVRLVTPKGGTVLDPFNGSGSTGKACMYENADRNANYKYIGIELTEEYLPISKARIEFAEKNPIMNYEDKTSVKNNKVKDETKNVKNSQSTIFDL